MVLTRWLRNVLDVAGSRKARRRFAGRSFVPRLEPLEDRVTPAGIITINNVQVEDASGKSVTSILDGQNPGNAYKIAVTFTTQNLSADASYQIAVNVNGFIQYTNALNLGAGISGQDGPFSGTVTFPFFSPVPGTNQVLVTAVPTPDSPDFQANPTSITFNGEAPTFGEYIYSPAQIRQAYGINSINIPSLGGQAADGAGQTIAIIDGYNDPLVFTDLDAFDQDMSLTTTSSQTLLQQYGQASSFLRVFNQDGEDITSEVEKGGPNVPPIPPDDQIVESIGETNLDVQWAHAIAPGAHIDLFECNSLSQADLQQGAEQATTKPGVSVISMSWGSPEAPNGFYTPGDESTADSHTYVTPSGHTGITFLASSGDNGNPGGYPALSPHVVAVGGTDLSLNNGEAYGSETAWSTTLENGSPSYSQFGTWTTQSGGFSGTYSTADSGSINANAYWSIPTFEVQDQNGNTTVYATWTANKNNATKALYAIYDGNTLLTPNGVAVNQTLPPNGDVANGNITIGNTPFQKLGTFALTSNTLNVRLDASDSNGTVVADALYISPNDASGGGISANESQPSCQNGVVSQSTTHRTSPDVAFEAGGNSTVVSVLNGTPGPAVGTSLSAPCWAGLIALADQGRASLGKPSLDSTVNSGSTLNALYSLPAGDFHDITAGYNGNPPANSGFSAGPGYDLLTGRGSPIANLLIPDLVNYNSNPVNTLPPPSPSPSAPPAAPPSPPALNVPPLLAMFDSLLGGVETVNADGTETITDSLFGIPLLVAKFDHSGHLVTVTLFGFNVTFLFA